ncbi:protein phosphatase 2C domain-containing protein [Candidatus Gottesmanbacteria bacterium]|nr:protein phosphatase 2C domain-containing protein [Candidatus Gottesmanbacteria bacterium]
MKLPDPWKLKYEQPKDVVLFAASQLTGGRPHQEDYFVNFNDECFIVADGVGGMPHGAEAAKLACETAEWAYRLVRQRPFYWNAKDFFLKRIVRSTNMRLWQKRREPGFADGLATTLLVFLANDRRFWVGSVGDTSAFLFRDAAVRKLTTEDVDNHGNLTKILGVQRFGIVPQIIQESFLAGDVIVLASDGVARYVANDEMAYALKETGATTQRMTDAVAQLLKTAQKNGSTDNMTALIIKKIALPQ